MKRVTSIFILISLFSQLSIADCDWTKINKNEDGSYTYSKELHICVGEMKRDLDIAKQQVQDLNKAIELKDLAISKGNERVQLWQDTAYKLEDRINKVDDLQSRNSLIYFGLGAITVLGAGYMASKLIR